MKSLTFADSKQTQCANEFVSMLDTLGVTKTELNETEKSLTITTTDDIDEFNEEWIRGWIKKSCFSDVFDQKKGIKIIDEKIKIFFLNPIKK